MGVVFPGEPKGVELDKVLESAILPEGWRMVPTDHGYYTDMVDDKGRRRASCFYKAAFYDRDAFVGTCTRYNVHLEYDKGPPTTVKPKPKPKSKRWDGDTIAYYPYDPYDPYEPRVFRPEPEQEEREYTVYNSPKKRYVARDGATVLFATEWVPDGDYSKGDALRVKATAYLDENFPEWKDYRAYWDTP